MNGLRSCRTPAVTSGFPCPYKKRNQPGAVGPGVHPRRHSGPLNARHQPPKAKQSTDSVSGPSCKIEANDTAPCGGTVAGPQKTTPLRALRDVMFARKCWLNVVVWASGEQARLSDCWNCPMDTYLLVASLPNGYVIPALTTLVTESSTPHQKIDKVVTRAGAPRNAATFSVNYRVPLASGRGSSFGPFYGRRIFRERFRPLLKLQRVAVT